MAVSHVFSNAVADATGTITVWNGSTTASVAATNVVRPSDWNSAHNQYMTLSGNTAGNSTVSGTNIVFQGGNQITLSGTGSTVVIQGNTNATVSTYVPYFPASTSSQTMGGFGTTSASALVFPIPVVQDIAFNHIKVVQSASVITTTAAGGQTISSSWGLYSNNAGTLSQISSGSYSFALTASSVSHTISFPATTATGGYTWTTSQLTATAQAQSLFGTAGNRVADLVFGNSMSLTPGVYYLGVMHRQSTSGTAVGLSTAWVGNAMNGTTNVGAWGLSTAAHSSRSEYHLGAHGFYTSTGSAGYGGTALPSSFLMNGFNNNVNVMPMLTFAST